MNVPKRIHVAPLGFEHDRIIKPLFRYDADQLILVTMRDEKYGLKHLENVKETLKENDFTYVVEEVDLLDLVDCIRVFGKIIYEQTQQGHNVFVNISSSTSISSIGASFAAMLWDATPYHAQPKEWVQEDTREPGEPITHGLANVFQLQKLQIDIPDRELLYILNFIKDNSWKGKIRYNEVMKDLEEKGWLDASDAKYKQQTLTRQFQSRYLSRLKDKWNFVDLKGKTRARKISLTEKGERYLKMFEYLVE